MQCSIRYLIITLYYMCLSFSSNFLEFFRKETMPYIEEHMWYSSYFTAATRAASS